MDYQSNSKKEKVAAEVKKSKNVERVVTGEVLVKKKSVGTKFKDLFIAADFRSVFQYVVSDVLIPAARNMIVDGASKGVERMMYGDRGRYRTPGGRQIITYNNVGMNRGMGGSPMRTAPPITVGSRTQRAVRDEFIIATREEAERVLEMMNDIIDTYDVVSVADFNEMIGYPSDTVDNKWGWTYLNNAQVRQIREGFVLDLPPAEPIQ